jgi:hypothetical protein
MRKIIQNISAVLFIMVFAQALYTQVNDSLAIDYNYINTYPQNAEVYANDVYIGSTPLFFKWQDSTFPKQVKIRLNGYAEYSDFVTDGSLMKKTYTLVPLTGNGRVDLVMKDKNTHFEKPRKIIPIVLSALVTAGAGAAAYYFKTLAIENRDHYDTFGDQESLDKKKEYDIISGVSLALFQVGMGALIYFLLIDK